MATINPKKLMKKGLAGGINNFMSIADAGMEFWNRRSTHPDESLVASTAWAGASYAAWKMFPGIMWGYTLGEFAKEAGKELVKLGATHTTDQQKRYNAGGQLGFGFQDSEQAYTARQRGIQAIQNSRMNARSVLGNEARSLHQR